MYPDLEVLIIYTSYDVFKELPNALMWIQKDIYMTDYDYICNDDNI